MVCLCRRACQLQFRDLGLRRNFMSEGLVALNSQPDLSLTSNVEIRLLVAANLVLLDSFAL